MEEPPAYRAGLSIPGMLTDRGSATNGIGAADGCAVFSGDPRGFSTASISRFTSAWKRVSLNSIAFRRESGASASGRSCTAACGLRQRGRE